MAESTYFSKEVGEGFSDDFGGTTLNLATNLADLQLPEKNSQLLENGQLPKNGNSQLPENGTVINLAATLVAVLATILVEQRQI